METPQPTLYGATGSPDRLTATNGPAVHATPAA